MRIAPPFSLDRRAVRRCLDLRERGDALFSRAFERSLAVLDPAYRRGALGGVTGHVAESVVEILLVRRGWTPVWHFDGPGRHGVDLLLLDRSLERMFAVEVKGTLRPRFWPRLTTREVEQMDPAWLDKCDNPAMQDWGMSSADIHGAVVLVSFEKRAYKLVLTSNFASWHAITNLRQLDDLDWLD